MMRLGVALLLVVALACSAEEDERGRRHGSDDDASTSDLAGVDAAVSDLAGDTVARPDAPGPADALDAPDPGPQAEPDPFEASHPEPHETTALPEPEPQPEAIGPEPQPEVIGPEPQPEVVVDTTETTPPVAGAYEVQTSSASLDCVTDAPVTVAPVRLEGLVLTSPRFVASSSGALDGYYAADAASTGPYHGLLLVVPTSLGTDFVVGDVVTVEGDHKEYYCLTEVLVASMVQTGVAWEPAPLEVGGWQLAATDPASEPYEGSLVRVEGGSVTELDAFGEIVIDGTWRIANEFDLPYLADDGVKALGDQIVSVTGVVEFSWGKYLVNPRFESDLVVAKP
jgi:hypothetical protein